MGGGISLASAPAYKMQVNAASAVAVEGSSAEWIAQGPAVRLTLKSDAFENVSPIGKGKFGLVFLAKQTAGLKHVAIKYIPKQIIFDTQGNKRIQKEMTLLARLSHPFTVMFYGGFETPTCFALVCEYCIGGELYNLLRKRVKVSEQEAMFYFCELASVLRYLHEDLKVVYRDLKPENILIDVQGHLKLCDFGFSTECNGEVDELTDGCGTAMYIAPEIASGFTKYGHGFGVDWWALGCILFEMLTGSAPFGDSDNLTKFEIFNNINEKSVSCPIFMNQNIKVLIKGLLEKKSDKRFTWSNVKDSAWLTAISWEDVEKKSIVPPWIPKAASVASVENFVNWEIMLPQSLPSSAVISYCTPLIIPKKQQEVLGDPSEKLFQKRSSNANLVKAPSNLNKQQSSQKLATQPSARGQLSSQTSSKKFESTKVKASLNESAIQDKDKRSPSTSGSMSPVIQGSRKGK